MEVSAYRLAYSTATLSVEHGPSSTLFIPAAPELHAKKPTVVRRTSSVTDEDRENALKVRKNALKSNGGMFFYVNPPWFVP